MEGYGITLGKYDSYLDTYVTAGRTTATHIVNYGEGAVIHAEPLTKNTPKALKKLAEGRFKDIENLSFRKKTEKVSMNSIDRKVREAQFTTNTPIQNLSKVVERLDW